MTERERRTTALAKLRELAEAAGPLPCSMLAISSEPWTFVPEECTDEFLQGFVEGRYDSMNSDPDLVEREREQAKAELSRRSNRK